MLIGSPVFTLRAPLRSCEGIERATRSAHATASKQSVRCAASSSVAASGDTVFVTTTDLARAIAEHRVTTHTHVFG